MIKLVNVSWKILSESPPSFIIIHEIRGLPPHGPFKIIWSLNGHKAKNITDVPSKSLIESLLKAAWWSGHRDGFNSNDGQSFEPIGIGF